MILLKKYQKKHNISAQSKAVASLVKIAINEIESDNSVKKFPSTAEAAPGEDHIIALYRELNHEGREKLIDYADDLVTSGKYIKSGPDSLGKKHNK